MIQTSLFELFKIGPGPSSSHTVGPMIATRDFRQQMEHWIANNPSRTDLKVRVELYGALASTGKGHGTDRAVVAGLLNEIPETVDIHRLNRVFQHKDYMAYTIDIGDLKIPFSEADIFFDYDLNPKWHPNTLRCVLQDEGKTALEETYFSVGGGFIETEGSTKTAKDEIELPYPYGDMDSLVTMVKQKEISIARLLLKNEMAISGLSKQEIYNRIERILEVMHNSVLSGLKNEGILPGGLNVQRRAKQMISSAESMERKGQAGNALFARLNAYALATSEENAAGQMVVTAPTNGAAGVIPACLEYLRNDCSIPEKKLKKGLLVAGMIGFIIKDKASISGAALGCQAEVGSAASMAAALFAYCFDQNIDTIAEAAEIALEHHLGMTCDPIKGLVQVPCIERNANGAVKAYNAYLLSLGKAEKPIISFDQVVRVMKETGEDLSAKYKETSTGGLATSFGWGNMPGS